MMAEKKTLEQIFKEKDTTPTLKALAHVHDLPPVRFYTVAKQPQEGKVYDPNVYNWDAVQRFIERRFDAEDAKFSSLEEVVDAAIKADEELKLQDGRRGGKGGVKIETFEAEVKGEMKEVQKRKYPSLEKEANQPVVLKKDPNVYKIVFQTSTHTVLVPVNSKMEPKNDDVIIKSNLMLNLNAVPPTSLEQEVKARFDADAAAEKKAPTADKDKTAEPAKQTPEKKR